MSEYTKGLVNVVLPQGLTEMRADYKKNGIPTILDESLNQLLLTVSIKQPKRILEVGTATGCSGIAMLSRCNANLYTIEIEEREFTVARQNFLKFGLQDRVKQVLGDSLEVLDYLDGEFDFVFLDGSKSKYIDCLKKIEPHLTKGAVVFCDNVLFRGYVDGRVKCPHKYNTIKRKMREFLEYMSTDGKYCTSVLDIGDGVSVSYYIGEDNG